jgi:hypothetical protein
MRRLDANLLEDGVSMTGTIRQVWGICLYLLRLEKRVIHSPHAMTVEEQP